uniref:Tudor domain-containing protein n=1 Tax=Plectus sambesii TaxID=2011161 RepID=A0A914XHE0_9BILA
MLPTIRFRPKAFEYRVCLGNTQGDITEEGNAIQEKVADESRVAVRELPILCVPASINDYLDVIISHAKAFDRVYVQLLNQVSALTEVNDRLQRFYESGSSSLKQLINPYRGQLCAVKDNQSGRYYRAAVVCRPDPINIQVYCIDYGMTLNVGKEEVLQLAAGFNNLPPQAIAVQLSDVIEDRVRMSLDQFTACFETKLVTIRLDGRKEDKYLVSMAIINGKRAPVNVSDIVMGMASMPGDQSAAATEPLYVSPSKSSMASTDNGAGLREQEVVPQMAQLQVNVQHKDPPQPSGYPTPPLSERASSIAIVTKIEPAVVSVPAQDVCVRVDGPMARPWCFYVQLERFAEQLRQMEAEIREPSTPLDEATVGAACIA